MQDDISILIVDDSKFNCAMIKKTLTSGGYANVTTARSAKEGLEVMLAQSVDVLIADWMMPEMDGLQLTNNIRQIDEERNHYTYILLLTGKDGVEPMVHAFEQGVDDYLTKPPNKFELLARIYAAGRISGLQNTLLESAKSLTRMNRALKGKLQTDPLTGFSNLNTIEKRMMSLLKASETRDGVLCVALLRFLNFYEVTENVSRRVKDEITLSVSRRLKRTVRPTDEIAIIDESEYLVIMFHSEKKKFQRYSLQRISNAISVRQFSTSAGFIQIKAKIKVVCSEDMPTGSQSGDILQLLRGKFDE